MKCLSAAQISLLPKEKYLGSCVEAPGLFESPGPLQTIYLLNLLSYLCLEILGAFGKWQGAACIAPEGSHSNSQQDFHSRSPAGGVK